MKRPVVIGFLLGLLAAMLWGGYAVLARGALLDGLLPVELAALRFAAAGLAFLPLAWRTRHALRQIGFWRMLALTLLGGGPNVLLFAAALSFTPASQAATIAPMTVAISGTLLAIPLLGEVPSRGRVLALAVMMAGVVLVGLAGFTGGMAADWRGYPLLVTAGVTYGLFTVMLQRWRCPALPATVGVSIMSGLLLAAAAGVAGQGGLAALPWTRLVWYALSQGVLCGAFAFLFYARSAELLGGRAAVMPALVPVAALALSVPLLGERPGPVQLAGMALAVGGMAAAVLFTGRVRRKPLTEGA
jgi:drug/metabolite transporter (DMT)-like permease